VANPNLEKVAWVFPGQGSQRVGMGHELTQFDPGLAALYATADDTLGFTLSDIIFNGPESALQETPVQQPAILLTSIAYLHALRNRGLLPDADYVAGHSLGEYAAMVAAGSLAFEDALRLVRRRGELMQEHGAGAMAAILGLAAEDVAAIARDAGAEVANFNTPVQTTVSGRVEAVERAIALARERGAKRALLLPVSGAFHSTLMAPVAEAMRPLIDQTTMQAGRVPLVADVDARFLCKPADLRHELVDQICGSVRWVDVVGALVSAGVTTFYEIGPEQVLAGLVGRCAPKAAVFTAERMVADAVTPA
jgi:[acyl-carrier-protein] S-malonyltransferase